MTHPALIYRVAAGVVADYLGEITSAGPAALDRHARTILARLAHHNPPILLEMDATAPSVPQDATTPQTGPPPAALLMDALEALRGAVASFWGDWPPEWQTHFRRGPYYRPDHWIMRAEEVLAKADATADSAVDATPEK